MASATKAQKTFGTSVTWAGHDIGFIVDGSYTGLSAEEIDLSSQESVFKEFAAGQIDSGMVNLTIRFIPGDTTGQKFLYTDMKASTEREVIITYPDDSTWTFNAIVTKFGDLTFNKDGSADAAITLKVTGEPTHSDLT